MDEYLKYGNQFLNLLIAFTILFTDAFAVYRILLLLKIASVLKIEFSESGVRSQNSGEGIFHFFVVSGSTWAASLKIGVRDQESGVRSQESEFRRGNFSFFRCER